METFPLDIAAEGIPEDVWGQSLFLLDSAEWLIAAPLSPGAARWWGRFTDWCTAETLPSFWEYNDKGPLIVFCSRLEGRRWQLHPVTGEFRDENNRAVSWRRFLGRYPAVMEAVVNVLTLVRSGRFLPAPFPDPEVNNERGPGPEAPAAGGAFLPVIAANAVARLLRSGDGPPRSRG